MKKIIAIIEPDPIVSLDISNTLEDVFTDAIILSFDNLNTAMTTMLNHQHLDTIFVNSRLFRPESESIFTWIAQQSKNVILLGKSKNVDFAAKVIDFPFTSKMVLDAVRIAATG